jgi:phage tail-like protein
LGFPAPSYFEVKMARSSLADPVDKFRFRVSVVSIDLSLTGAIETAITIVGPNSQLQNLAVLQRAGFSEISLPQANVSEMSYRENIDNQRFSKIPGLVKYDPVVLRRGVTKNRDLYDWYRLVNEEIALISVAQELNQDSKYTPVQSENFRKDVIIEVLDRKGNPVKGWYLFNAWPIRYKPGNDLAANAEEKLIEEISLTYEFFLELEGGAQGFQNEMLKGLLLIPASSVLNKKLPFLR